MKKLTLAFIANGKSTNRYHLPFILQRQDKFMVKIIYQRDLSKVEWKRIEGIHYTDHLSDVLEDPSIDVVIITTPSTLHYEMAIQVLNAGKHCVLEKPFTETLAQAQALFNLSHSKGLMIQCYQNRRFDGDFLTAMDLLQQGKLGDLQELELTFDYDRPQTPLSVQNFSRINSYYYGHACHAFDQVLSRFGRPKQVVYDVRQLLGTGRLNDYYDVDLFYDTFKVSLKSSFFRIKPRPSLSIYGKEGTYIKETKDKQEFHLKQFRWPDDKDFGKDTPEEYGLLYTRDENLNPVITPISTVLGDYGRYYDALYDHLVHGKAKLVKDEETLWQIEFLEAGIKELT